MEIPEQWTFKTREVADGFDQHVREQLPWYELTTLCVAHIARHYIPEGGLVYDLGCATGNIGQAIRSTLDDRGARLVAVDNSAEMQNLYQGHPEEFVLADLSGFKPERYDLCVCFLTLMFLPTATRHAVVQLLKQKLNPGGALIVFDKCTPSEGYLSTVMYRMTLAGKVSSGVPAEEIIRKELSLGGIQRPISMRELGSGFAEVFRFGDFAGWVYEGDSPLWGPK